MNYTIRKFNTSDYDLIASWWNKSDKQLSKYAYPDESSYIIEVNNTPFACASLYLMNSPIVCMIENLISDPLYKLEDKTQIINQFILELECIAKDKGYVSVIAMTYVDKLKDKYLSLGYQKITENLTVFAKSLKEV